MSKFEKSKYFPEKKNISGFCDHNEKLRCCTKNNNNNFVMTNFILNFENNLDVFLRH